MRDQLVHLAGLVALGAVASLFAGTVLFDSGDGRHDDDAAEAASPAGDRPADDPDGLVLESARRALLGRTIVSVGQDGHGNLYLLIEGGNYVAVGAATTEGWTTTTTEER